MDADRPGRRARPVHRDRRPDPAGRRGRGRGREPARGTGRLGLLAVLERTAGRPRRAWTITALAVLALSLTGPLGSAADTASLGVLTAMHLLVGAVLIPGLALSARARRES